MSLSSSTPSDMRREGFVLLPEAFVPGPMEVLIGRGKKCVQHNQRFRAVVHSRLQDYMAAESKSNKSAILLEVMASIRKDSVYGGFVKKDAVTGRWYSVDDINARNTCAQSFRDALHVHYKSSRQFKQKKRKQQKEEGSSSEDDEPEQQRRTKSPRMRNDSSPVPPTQVPSAFDLVKAQVACSAGVNDIHTDLPFLLSQAFTASISSEGNPFEPTPIAENPLSFPDSSSFLPDGVQPDLKFSGLFGAQLPEFFHVDSAAIDQDLALRLVPLAASDCRVAQSA